MKILVAGNGFIGRKLVERLRENHIVKTLDRSSGTFTQDITKEFHIAEEFDVVFHTIGLAPGMHSKKEYEKVHIQGTKNLLNGVKTDKIVYISALGTDKPDHSFFETKRVSEKIIESSDLDYTIIRPSTVYGEGNKLIELMKKAAPLKIFPDLKVETQPIHIEDLVELMERSVDDFNGEILEVGGPEVMKVSEMAKKIYGREGHSCLLVPAPLFLQKIGLGILSPLPGPFNLENIKLLEQQNIVEENDAERILGELREI